MINKVLVSAQLSSRALAAVSAACMGLACVGCMSTAKPAAAPSAPPTSGATATVVPSATAVASAKPANLVADATVRQELLAAFIAFRSNAANTPGYAPIPPSAVAGIAPGTLFYALDPTTGTYWAAATFSATAAASQTSAFVGFQDGGSQAVFMRTPGEPWQVKSVGPCLAGLPVAIAATWALTANASPMCPSGVPAG
jgi:hypothetical protein